MRVFVWLTAAALLVAACGSSSSSKADPATDQKTGATINLKQTDFPAGWTSTPHTNDPSGKKQAAALDACLGIPDPATSQTTQTYSDDFSQAQNQVSSEVDFTKTKSQANSDFKAADSDKAVDCIKQAFSQSLQGELQSAGATVADMKVDKRTVAHVHGTNAVGYRAVVTVSAAGQQIPVTADVALVQKNRAEGTVTFVGLGNPIPDDLQTKLITAFENRM